MAGFVELSLPIHKEEYFLMWDLTGQSVICPAVIVRGRTFFIFEIVPVRYCAQNSLGL